MVILLSALMMFFTAAALTLTSVVFMGWAEKKMKIRAGTGDLNRLPSRSDVAKVMIAAPLWQLTNNSNYKRKIRKTLEYANQIYQCPDCKRYNRVYQIEFTSKCKCVHCDSSRIYQVRRCTDLSADVLEFLANFPDCPQINKKQYRAWWAWYDARERREEIEKANAEIEQIMRNHAESGVSNYIKRIYEEGR